MDWNTNTKLTAIGTLLLLFLLIFPWKGSIIAPALLEFQQHAKVFAPQSAKIETLAIRNGDIVKMDQQLMQLTDPELTYQIEQAKRDIDILQTRLRTEVGQTETLGIQQTDQAELARKSAELQALQDKAAQLNITAPIAGKVTNLDGGLKNGRWVVDKMPLLEIIDPRKNIITAYVNERDYQQIKHDKTARFYSDVFRTSPVLTAKIVNIDQVTTQSLSEPYLASTYGGDIAVHDDPQRKLITKDALYRVVLVPEKSIADLNYATRGKIQLAGKGRSLLTRAWTAVTAVFIRESGF